MTDSADIYALTNPAFGAVVLRSFAVGHAERGSTIRASLPLFYIVGPLVLSEELAATLEGTNASTGFFAWLTRSPSVLPGFGARMRATRDWSRRALAFALYHRGLLLQEDGAATPGPGIRMPIWPASDARGRSIRDAAKLGHWVAAVEQPAEVYRSLGVMP